MRKLIAATAFVALALSSTSAYAATGTATLSITATITTSCTFASPTQTIDLSTQAATSGSTTTPETLNITCTAGDPVTISASPGISNICSSPTRSMLTAATPPYLGIAYDLRIGATKWCDGSAGSTLLPFTGTGALQSLTYSVFTPGFATDLFNNNRPNPYPNGTYTDSITLTATF